MEQKKKNKKVILAHLLITASSAYHALSPDRKTLILGHGFVHSNVESSASVRMLRTRLVLEVAQPSRTPSRSHPQRRELHVLPATVTSLWTDQLWQAVCQNVTILSVGMCSPSLSASSLLAAQLMSGL